MRFMGGCVLALGLFSFGAAEAAPRVEVRVRLKKSMSAMEVSGLALQIGQPASYVAIASPRNTSILRRAILQRKGQDRWLVRWRDSGEKETIKSDKLHVRGQMLRVGVEPVPYELELVPRMTSNRFDLVARLDLETYLAGVLPAEMPLSWPTEALKAQAIAARSFVLSRAFERRHEHFDVDSTILDQVYKFFHEIDDKPELRRKLDRILASTREMVMRGSDGRILRAYYSADCGCQSEDPRYVWGESGSYVSVKDATCQARKTYVWNAQYERNFMRSLLVANFALPESSRLETISISSHTPSGRVNELMANFRLEGKSRRVVISGQEFRRLFGFDQILSSDFTFQWRGPKLQIDGRGLGHGVGMCQRGARDLARSGKSYREILSFYYPKAKISRQSEIL